MSLIHDALKKAEKPLPETGKERFPQFMQDPKEALDKPKSNVRVIILVIILVCSLGYMFYQKFYAGRPHKPFFSESTKKPSADAAASKGGKQGETVRLKDEAVNSFRQNNLDDAWVRLSTASQIDPHDPQIWNNLGLISRKRGDIVKAREYFERALQIKPEYPECLNNLAVIDINDGNFDIAQERLRKAFSINPQYADAAFHLALIAEKSGDIRVATSFYKKFLELAKDADPQFSEDVKRHVANIEVE